MGKGVGVGGINPSFYSFSVGTWMLEDWSLDQKGVGHTRFTFFLMGLGF
jgi:hypothetical protein